MGVSHSKNNDESWAVDRRSNRKRSPTMKKTDDENKLNSKTYAEKPRSVSSNFVLERSGNNGNLAPPASSSSSSSLSSSLRSKMTLLKKPASRGANGGVTRNSSTTSSTRSNTKSISSTTATTDSNAGVVNSFMTNISSGGGNPATNALLSYPYPRSHSTNLVLPLRPSATTNSGAESSTSGLRRPLTFRKGQTSGTVGYGRSSAAVLQIPSPVPSVSEPSASEDTLSRETLENSEPITKGRSTAGGDIQLRHVDSPSNNRSNGSTTAGLVVSDYVSKPTSTSASGNFSTTAGLVASDYVSKPTSTSASGNFNVDGEPDVMASTRAETASATSGMKTRLPPPPPTSTSFGFNYASRVRGGGASATGVRAVSSISDSRLAGATATAAEEANVVSNLSSNDNGERNKQEGVEEAVSVATIVEEEEAVSTDDNTCIAGCRVKRPDSLLAKSSFPARLGQQQGSRFASWKLRHQKGAAAPLAESESFIVENSPAVEVPPQTYAMNRLVENRATKPLDAASPGATNIPSTDAAASLSSSKMGATVMGTRLQSRLKNPSAYEQRQRTIYGRYAGGGQQTIKNECKSEDNCPSATTAVAANETTKIKTQLAVNQNKTNASSKLSSTSPRELKTCADVIISEKPKQELQDSGVKVDSAGASGASSGASDTNGSKGTSPEGSLHRGLIDDEIRDQPELTIGRSDGSVAEQHSQITTIQEELPQVECGGPVRLRDRARKRHSTSGGGSGGCVPSRMIESYDSTVSSLSIDSEDLMIDYELTDFAEGEEVDLLAPTAVSECASVHSSLGRRSSCASRTGTLGRKKGNSPADGGKRASMDAVMSELASLKNETEKGSNHSQLRQRALSDFPSPSSSSTSGQHAFQSPAHYNRVLRPPLSLECAGLSTINLDQQTYRHMVQDVTVMKTLLLRLKRSLQETETANPFGSSLTLKNGIAKSALIEMEMQKNEERLAQLTKDDLKEENAALRTQIAVMRQQLEEQTRIIQCLQHQLKNSRQRSLRKAESIGEPTLSKGAEERKERATTEPSKSSGSSNTANTCV